jgi:hypothetical protein
MQKREKKSGIRSLHLCGTSSIMVFKSDENLENEEIKRAQIW